MNRATRRIGVGSLIVLMTAAGVVLPGVSAGAAASYEGSASSQGVLQSVANESFPFGVTFQGAGPTTTATLTSLKDSRATAVFLDPGDGVRTLPGVACGAYGVQCPEFPFVVSTSFGDAPQDAEFGVSSLHAESGADNALATGTAGNAAAGGSASSRVSYNRAEDSLTATARSAYHALDLGGRVTLSGVRALAESMRTSDGKRTDVTSLSIARLSTPGLTLILPKSTPGSVSLPNPIPGLPQAPPLELPPVPNEYGGQAIVGPDIGFVDGVFTVTLPVDGKPATFAVPAKAIADAFAAQGVTFSFQQATRTRSGVVSPALSVSFTIPAPPANSGFNGPTTVVTTLGNAAASASLVAEGVGTAEGDVTPTTGTAGTAGVIDAAAAGPVGIPAVAPGGGIVPATGAPPTVQFNPVAPVATPVVAGGLRLTGSAEDLAEVYLLVVAVAALCLGGGFVLRIFGVRI